jgi:hypothetical protein
MPDCSDLKDKYDKAKADADRARDKADYAKDRFDDAQDNFDFENGRDCSYTTPDAQAQCLRERERASTRYENKMEKERARMQDKEHDAENAEGGADTARIEWCACMEHNRDGDGDSGGDSDPEPDFDFDESPASEPGDWNEPDWTGYAVA